MIEVRDRRLAWPMRFASWAEYRERVAAPATPPRNGPRLVADTAALSATGFYRFIGGPLHGETIPSDVRLREGVEVTIRHEGAWAVYLLDPMLGAFVCRYFDWENA